MVDGFCDVNVDGMQRVSYLSRGESLPVVWADACDHIADGFTRPHQVSTDAVVTPAGH
jgi:hypothetical protein